MKRSARADVAKTVAMSCYTKTEFTGCTQLQAEES